MSAAADHSLELARRLRAAIREREETLRKAIEEYDKAITEVDRWATAAAFMFAVDRADARYRARLRWAAGEARRKDAELVGDED